MSRVTVSTVTSEVNGRAKDKHNAAAVALKRWPLPPEGFVPTSVSKEPHGGRAGWCTPELLRIRGRRLLLQGNRGAAEALILRSIETARRQGALAWELRTAISLAEL